MYRVRRAPRLTRIHSPGAKPLTLAFDLELEFHCDGTVYPFGLSVEQREDQDTPTVYLYRLSRCCKLPYAEDWNEVRYYCPRCSRQLGPKDKTIRIGLSSSKPAHSLSRRRRREASLSDRLAALEKWYRLEDADPLLATVVIQSIGYDSLALVKSLMAEAGGVEALLPGLRKKFLVYPGETRKLTLEAFLEARLESVLEREF